MKNRLPSVISLILLCFANSFSQIVEDRGNFGLHTVDDSVLQYKYLKQENQLLLVGWNHIQLLDLTNFKTIETWPLDMPVSDRLPGFQGTDWPISPDGRRLLLLGLGKLRKQTKSETKQAAWALDLKTGKRTALLDHPDFIRSAEWSKNGKTLMTRLVRMKSFC